MSSFLGTPQYVLTNSGLARNTRIVRFYKDDSCTGEYVELPIGAISNFATIPKILQFIFRPKADDIRMPSRFHDAMVGEFGLYIPIMEDGNTVRMPSWDESAKWFRKMIQVRQRVTRRRLPTWKKIVFIGIDCIYRWLCWSTVILYGIVRNK